MSWASVFLPADRGGMGPQRVTSLYLDTPSLAFLRWHRDGRPDRFKLRVRAYGDGCAASVFLEVKRRTAAASWKHRTEVPTETLPAWLGASPRPTRLGEVDDADEFASRRLAFGATPVIRLTCLRESLRCRGIDGEVAVTVDRDLAYQAAHGACMAAPGQPWWKVPLPQGARPDAAVLEIKFERYPPAWLRPLVDHLAPWRAPMSKYRAAMDAHLLWSTPDVRTRRLSVGTVRGCPGPVLHPVAGCRPGLYAP